MIRWQHLVGDDEKLADLSDAMPLFATDGSLVRRNGHPKDTK